MTEQRTVPVVLVVEDDEDNREMIVAALRDSSCAEIAVAENGAEALEVARRVRPTLVLLDLGLPIIDGWEVARHFRRDPAHRDVTIIALSGYASNRDQQEAVAAGCDYCFAKPFDIDALMRMIPIFLRGVRLHKVVPPRRWTQAG